MHKAPATAHPRWYHEAEHDRTVSARYDTLLNKAAGPPASGIAQKKAKPNTLRTDHHDIVNIGFEPLRGAALKHTILVVAFWAMGVAALAQDFAPVPKQLTRCSAPVRQGDDNDIRIRTEDRQPGHAVPMPDAVARSIDAATEWVTRPSRDKALWKEEHQTDLSAMQCRDVYPGAHVVRLKDGLELYAVHAQSWVASWLLLVVYDPASGKATPKPAYVNTKWAGSEDPLLKKPYVATADLRGDGHQQIVVEERAHNGTLYNAVVYRYFDIAPDLALTNVMALEARTVDPFSNDEAMVLRTMTTLDNRRLRIDQSYATGKKKIAGGYAILESSGPGVPYRVVERHGVKKEASSHFRLSDGTLITMSEEEDDGFLKEGHGLYY
jgi:hypothetical protein